MYLQKTLILSTMIKALIASSAVVGIAALVSPAQAENFYLNPEFNAAFSGSDYSGSVLDAGIGYEDGGFYAQIGPSVLWVDGGETEVGFSGKTGVTASVSSNLNAYGEVSFAKYEDIDAGYGLKVGTKYSF